MKILSKDICEYVKEKWLKASIHIVEKEVEYNSFSSINNLTDNSITWIKNIENFDLSNLKKYHNLLIVTNDLPSEYNNNYGINFVIFNTPRDLFFSLLFEFYDDRDVSEINEAILNKSTIVKTKNIGDNFIIGMNSFIDKDVIIGNNVVIENNVNIYGKVKICDNVNIGTGTIIGRQGFGYFNDYNGLPKKIPHIGGVLIKHDVDIAGNVIIDRGTIDNTIISEYTKINNFCHIGHNSIIGSKVFVGTSSIITGSCEIANGAYLAPGAIISKVKVGKNSFIGLGSVVVKDVEEKVVVVGVPAKKLRNID